MDFIRIIVFLLGAALAMRTVYSAIQTFVLPRAANDAISSLVFRSLRGVFNLRLKKAQTYHQRDRLMALYAPIGLLLLPPVFLILLFISFTLMYWAVGQVGSWTQALKVSGSALM